MNHNLLSEHLFTNKQLQSKSWSKACVYTVYKEKHTACCSFELSRQKSTHMCTYKRYILPLNDYLRSIRIPFILICLSSQYFVIKFLIPSVSTPAILVRSEWKGCTVYSSVLWTLVVHTIRNTQAWQCRAGQGAPRLWSAWWWLNVGWFICLHFSPSTNTRRKRCEEPNHPLPLSFHQSMKPSQGDRASLNKLTPAPWLKQTRQSFESVCTSRITPCMLSLPLLCLTLVFSLCDCLPFWNAFFFSFKNVGRSDLSMIIKLS